MSLAALETHGIAAPAGPSLPGRPPKLDWLALSLLRIDPSYQRPVTARGRKTIAAIVARFSWAKFSPVIVAPVPGASIFAIIDGQHRATAALILGYDRVPCCVAGVGPEDQAAIFAAVNGTVTPMSPLALFKAAKMAGEAWAVGVDRACRAAGIEPLTYPVGKNFMKPFQTQALGTLRKVWEKVGEERLRGGLAREAKRPGADQPGYWNSDAIYRAAGVATSQVFEKPGAGPKAPAARSAAPGDDTAEKIRWMSGKGYQRSYIAATLKVPYAQIDKALGVKS